MKYDYDLLVIGSGSAGFSAAEAARGTGRKIGIIEGDKLGGDCPNYACVPTKALLRSVKAFLELKSLKALGIAFDAMPTLSFEAVMKRRKMIVETLGGSRMTKIADKLGIDIISGFATFTDPHTVHVSGKEFTAARFVIATGTKTRVPQIPGLSDVSWISHREAIAFDECPSSMIVIGAGPVGCELSLFYAVMGTEVTLLQAASRILSREEPEISAVATEGLVGVGVNVMTSAEVVRAEKQDGGVRITARVGKTMQTVDARVLMLASGRTSNTGGLGCKAAGVKLDAYGTIETDIEMRTSQKHIWAAGDVDGGMQFTHTAHYEGRVAGHNAFSRKPLQRDERVVPRVTFVHPEVASVGMTEEEAKKAFGALLVGTFPLRGLGRGLVDGHRDGLIKLIADKKTRKIIGGHMTGERAGEVIHEIAMAMYGNMKIDDLADMIHAYPTYSEAVTAAASVAVQE